MIDIRWKKYGVYKVEKTKNMGLIMKLRKSYKNKQQKTQIKKLTH
jgi:hypothetical protein